MEFTYSLTEGLKIIAYTDFAYGMAGIVILAFEFMFAPLALRRSEATPENAAWRPE